MLKPKLNCAVRRWIASPLNYPQCNHLQDSLSCPEKGRVSRSFFKRFRANTRFQDFVSTVFHNFRGVFHISFHFSAKPIVCGFRGLGVSFQHDSPFCRNRCHTVFRAVAKRCGALPRNPADILKMSAKRLPRKPRQRGLLAILRRCRVILRGRFGQALRERVERDVERGRKT